jgi:hypothetical protein
MKKYVIPFAVPIVTAALVVSIWSFVDGEVARVQWLAMVLAALLIAAVWLLLDQSYSKRIATGGALYGEAWLNGVRIGRLSDAEHAAYQRVAHRNVAYAVEQIFNFVGAFCQLALTGVAAVAVLSFCVVVGLALVAPEALLAAFHALAQDDAAIRTGNARALHVLGGVLCFAAVVPGMFAAAIGPGCWGLRNVRAEAVGRMIRQRFGTPATGDVDVIVFDVLPERAASLATDHTVLDDARPRA